MSKFNKKVGTLVCTAVLAGFFSVSTTAATDEITAIFKPDPTQPHINKFLNTTPQTGMCPGHAASQCKNLNIFSLRNTEFIFYNNAPILGGHEDVRKGTMFKVPSEWRSLSVTHTSTNESATIEVRIAAIGTRMDFSRPPGQGGWGPGGANNFIGAPSPCVTTGAFAAGITMMLWFWIVPENAGICSRQMHVNMDYLRYYNLEYAYELRTPNPLEMSTGQYTGSISYAVGPGKDFDFGDTMIPHGADTLTLNFTLDVQHTLKVEVPPGGNRVELVPQGGWQSWLTQGRKPTRLFRDQTINISASSRFKMQMECQYSHGNTCALQDPVSDHVVPLNVSVSLPYGLTDASGQPVDRRPLRLDGSGTELFQPGIYVDRKPGTLHFEIPPNEVAGMIHTGQQRQYAGSVTVIWDSDV